MLIIFSNAWNGFQALFAGTVAENIGYGKMPDKIDMKKVEHAAKLANADGFIQKLSEGYETNVGQRGSCLSGGQRQRWLSICDYLKFNILSVREHICIHLINSIEINWIRWKPHLDLGMNWNDIVNLVRQIGYCKGHIPGGIHIGLG
jgi:hypothetical protein